MTNTRKVQMNIAIPVQYRDMLRRIAAEEILRDPRKSVSGASIASDLLLEVLREVEEERMEGGEKK